MRNVCSVDGCGGVAKGFQLCNKHYLRFKKHGSAEISSGAHAPLDIRFWTKVQKGAANECWLWRGTTMKNGYGRIGEGGRGGKSLSAHRVSCEMHHGPAPFFGAHVMHLCDNRSCVNPSHLRWDTPSANIKDAYQKKRKTSPFKRGEHHHGAVLSAARVDFIRANPKMTLASLATLFECSVGAIRAVRDGRTWRD